VSTSASDSANNRTFSTAVTVVSTPALWMTKRVALALLAEAPDVVP
jgi:hypothetical protein